VVANDQERLVTPPWPSDPTRVGNYTILGRLGRGGFGVVYVASPTERPEELLAVKVLKPEYSENADSRQRFLEKEIPAIARVKSQYVPKLLAHSGNSDSLWFATELVRGPSLQTAVVPHEGAPARPLTESAVWRLGLGIAEALEAIHDAGLVHRDLKPGNVLLVPEGPRVIDFSLVHLREMVNRDLSYQLSVGTPGYTPVEQIRRLSDAGHPADIFALGATLVFAATGHAPFRDVAHTNQGNPSWAGLPPRSMLVEVLSRCLYVKPGARPSLAELKAEFARQAGHYGGRSRNDFERFLPEHVMELIRTWRYQFDEVTRGRAQSRWDAPRPDPDSSPLDGTKAQDRTLTIDGKGPRRAGSSTKIQTGTGHPQRPRSGSPNVQWEHQLNDWVRAPVVVGYDVAVAASLDGTVVCLGAETGRLLCKWDLDAPVRTVVIIPFGALVGDGIGGVYAVHADSSQYEQLYHVPGGSAIQGCTPMQGDMVYMVSEDGSVWEINAHTLHHRLLHTMPEPAVGPVTAARGTVFAVSRNRVFPIDKANGQSRRSFPVPGLIYTAPVEVEDTVYFAGTDGVLYSVNDRARRLESVRIGVPVHGTMACDREKGLLYVGGADGAVRAFDVSGVHTKPVLQWTCGIGDEIGGITCGNGAVYCAADGKVVVLDGNSGTTGKWVNVGSMIVGAPAVYRNWVYVASLDGSVRCLIV
jgi:serine/threonine protein kinase/outer membrane protein assembly factor BamB